MRRVALAAVIVLSGCMSARPHPTALVQPQETGTQMIVMPSEYEELVSLDQEVEMLSAQQDCAGGCEAGARLCELSDRICAIADRDGDPQVQGLCVDGRERCARARERLAICACGP